MFRVLGAVLTFNIAYAIPRGKAFAKCRRCGKYWCDRRPTCFRSVIAAYSLPALMLIFFPLYP
jgi:poly(A) polymerase Pap1